MRPSRLAYPEPAPRASRWLVTALVSGVAVFLNSYAVKTFGDAGVYTTAKNLVAAALLAVLAALAVPRGAAARPTRPRIRGQWAGLAAVAVASVTP